MSRFFGLCTALFLTVLSAPAQTVRFRTTQGNIDVVLLPNDAPKTVENFMTYVNKGDYNNTVFHRATTPRFVIQGGGFVIRDNQISKVPEYSKVVNEYKNSNIRGTIAMAKLDGDPNSATNQWFFNVTNNGSNLDAQNGGFTVFGRVANNASLAVMDSIAALPVFNLSALGGLFAAFDTVPATGTPYNETTAVLVKSIELIEVPQVQRVQPAGAYYGLPGLGSYVAPGSYIEIFGANLAGTTREWAEGDFRNNNAPTSLDDVSVTINNQNAFISYISPTQINAQVPATVGNVTSAQVIVSSRGSTSTPVSLVIRPLAGALLAPQSFKVGDRQYVVAIRRDRSFVTNGTIPWVAGSPARPGETLLLFGSGYGAAIPGNPSFAGQIAQGETSLVNAVEFRIGGVRAQVTYSGLAPGLVGVYQFNVVVPPDAPNGDLTLTATQNGVATGQSLLLPVRAQ